MDSRVIKQIIIAAVYILVIGGISLGVYYFGYTTSPTCFDGIQNGKEEGVDCGTLACGQVCPPAIMPIVVNYVKYFKVNENDYDFVAQVFNPNSDYGASSVNFNLEISDSSGSLKEKPGTTYLRPGQTKYIVWTAVSTGGAVVEAKLNIKDAFWGQMNVPSQTVSFIVKNKDIKSISTGYQLESTIYNNSYYDFDKIDVSVILFDDLNNIIGVNGTNIKTFISKTDRYFKVLWNQQLSGQIERIDIEADTNLFDNSNFIKEHGTQERFQTYY